MLNDQFNDVESLLAMYLLLFGVIISSERLPNTQAMSKSCAKAPVVFKIGITCTPFLRWRAYEREGYQKMHLLHVTEEPGLVQMMEAAPGTPGTPGTS